MYISFLIDWLRLATAFVFLIYYYNVWKVVAVLVLASLKSTDNKATYGLRFCVEIISRMIQQYRSYMTLYESVEEKRQSSSGEDKV